MYSTVERSEYEHPVPESVVTAVLLFVSSLE